jgi:molecular chaperone DnaK (HSP70)
VQVPVSFTAEQRSAVAACGTSAGFHVLQVLSEATAVAVAHRADESKLPTAETCVVVDLGASCLDVTVLRVHCGVVSVDAHQRSDQLSGEAAVELHKGSCS